MNRDLRGRSEVVLVMQEFGVRTDSKTLDAAIRIAQHDQRFQTIKEYQKFFNDLARMMREKFPKCPCKACAKKKP